jgi:sulfoxide reductase heme-binding subunit YedZ
LARLLFLLNHRLFIWALLAVPMVVMTVAYRQDQMFYGEVLHESGVLSARLLMLTLAITPLRMLFPRARWPAWFLQRRRWFGVASFAYALQHTVVYLDKKADWSVILADGVLPEMWTGWLALGILVLLALSSNDFSVRLLRRSWKRLHRWVYVAAVLAFAHWVLIAFNFVPALVQLLMLAGLESYRMLRTRRPARANQ